MGSGCLFYVSRKSTQGAALFNESSLMRTESTIAFAEQFAMRERERTGEKRTIQELKEKYSENWGILPVEPVKISEQKAEDNDIREALRRPDDQQNDSAA
jgi:uncharacterized protein HemY